MIWQIIQYMLLAKIAAGRCQSFRILSFEMSLLKDSALANYLPSYSFCFLKHPDFSMRMANNCTRKGWGGARKLDW